MDDKEVPNHSFTAPASLDSSSSVEASTNLEENDGQQQQQEPTNKNEQTPNIDTVDDEKISTTPILPSNNNNNSIIENVNPSTATPIPSRTSPSESSQIPRPLSTGSISKSPHGLYIRTTASHAHSSYDLFATSSNNNNNTNDIAISFVLANNSGLSPTLQQTSSSRISPSLATSSSTDEDFSFSPQFIAGKRSKLGMNPAACDHTNCNHKGSNQKGSKSLLNNIWLRLKRIPKSFAKAFREEDKSSSPNSPFFGDEYRHTTRGKGKKQASLILKDMTNRVMLFASLFAKWIHTVVLVTVAFLWKIGLSLSSGEYKTMFSQRALMEQFSSKNISHWIQRIKNLHPDAEWFVGYVQQFLLFFVQPLSLSSARNYKLTTHQHAQLKAHFFACILILGFGFLEVMVGLFHYGNTHYHESSATGGEEEIYVTSIRNHEFLVGLLILFSGFYLLHRGFMFLIDLIVIFMKTTQEQTSPHGVCISKSTLEAKSNMNQQSFTPSKTTVLPIDSPLESSSLLTEQLMNNEESSSSFSSTSRLVEEGKTKLEPLFAPYTFSLWKRLRVLLRFANGMYATFLSLSILSEMVQYVLTTKFASVESTPHKQQQQPKQLQDMSIGLFTHMIVIFGLLVNGLSIYLFANYSNDGVSATLQKKKHEESDQSESTGFSSFLQSPPSDMRKGSANLRASSRYSNSANAMWYNTSPWFQQQFSSFHAALNSAHSSPLYKYYNSLITMIRMKIPHARFWIYRNMREAHIHAVLFLYMRAIYYSTGGLLFDFILCCMSTMTTIYFVIPVLKANGKVLLQTTPENLCTHLNACVKEVSTTVDGVLECHSEHFWALNSASLDEADEEEILQVDPEKRKQELIATIKVRIANDVQVDHQRVLQAVRKIFCSNGLIKEHNLTVQVEKNTILGLEKIHDLTPMMPLVDANM
ncbi:hypothetical protein FDP41_007584 [Naegleria fowleri]|uniref:Uncharacterized protein n=1 Tax=Naegleria fowleri TaxID=5763 RepID=A0A6A5CEC9_NAEFO|nr:uncharacterized protein FDP41_007584 [Naegleria fowleri]KAF0983669.1 hypothetical protein FDP41_007584 [Naegleria fowleri]CAG4717407.1 unnamed protein product [Naegleria fowleri]